VSEVEKEPKQTSSNALTGMKGERSPEVFKLSILVPYLKNKKNKKYSKQTQVLLKSRRIEDGEKKRVM